MSLPITERSPLLENGNGNRTDATFSERLLKLFGLRGDQPSWLHSFKFLLFGSWFNLLLVFVPLSILSDRLNWDAAYRFGFSFVAIMPLAAVSCHNGIQRDNPNSHISIFSFLELPQRNYL